MSPSNKYIDKTLDVLYPSRKKPINRARRIAKHVLKDVKDGIWPEAGDESSIENARSLQRKVVYAGGIAVFAYIFARSKGETLGNLQKRAFKIGTVLGDYGAVEIAGEFVAKHRHILGGSKLARIEIDTDTSDEALNLVEEGVKKFELNKNSSNTLQQG